MTYTAPQPAPQPVIADSSQNFIGPLLHENENLAQEGVVVEVAAAVDIHDLPDDEVAAAVGIDDLPDIADLPFIGPLLDENEKLARRHQRWTLMICQA